MKPQLSIVCPALSHRFGKWRILNDLHEQCEKFPRKAELLILADNGSMTIGEKMNELYRMARGAYIVGVGDDDEVSADYVETILENIGDTDVLRFDHHFRTGTRGTRPVRVGPLSPIRAEICKGFQYPSINQGEDGRFREYLKARDLTIKHVPKVLYTSIYRREKSEFDGKPFNRRAKFKVMA